MKIKVYYSLAIGVLLGLAACTSQTSDVTTDVASNVSIEDIKLSSIEKVISTTGTVSATKEATLTTEMGGTYKVATNPQTGKAFTLGDKVQKGQAIIELEDEEYLNGIGLESKELSLEIAEQDYTKQSSLYEKGGVTESELSSAKVSLVNAKDSYALAQIQLSKMKVVAPFSGIITSMPYNTVGTKVSSGVEVVSLMSYENLILEVNLAEKYINDVSKGMEIRVMNYTLPNDTLHGQISQLSPAVSTETRTFETTLTVNNNELKLRPGMFVQAEIIVDRKENVVVIAKDVIVSNQRGESVFIVEDGTAIQKDVSFGYENTDNVEIISGLSAGDRLVIDGYETLRNRAKVKIIQ